MKRIHIALLALVSISVFAATHRAQTAGGARKAQRSLDYRTLVDKLRAEIKQSEISEGGDLTQPFFSVKAKLLSISGNDVQVFEYKSPAAADAEAKRVSSDGASIGATMINWMSAPHFYKSRRIIVLYVGTDEKLIGALGRIVGPQFAGR